MSNYTNLVEAIKERKDESDAYWRDLVLSCAVKGDQDLVEFYLPRFLNVVAKTAKLEALAGLAVRGVDVSRALDDMGLGGAE